LIQGGSVFSSYHRRAITSSGRRRRAWAHAGDDRERIAGWPGEADRMRVGPPMAARLNDDPLSTAGVQVHTRPTRSNADCPYEFQGRSRGSGAADEQLDGCADDPCRPRCLGLAAGVVQQPTECAVSMNFIVLS